MLTDNLILKSDGYKIGHFPQYKPGTTNICSYFEARKGGLYPETVFFSLQFLIKRHLLKPVIQEDVNEAAAICKIYFGSDKIFNYKGWNHLVKDHSGRLPIRIKAIPEGTVVPESNILMWMENTCPECYWLTNFLETIISHVWYGTTVATNSYYDKKLILEYLKKTGTPEDILYKLVDFGGRGSTTDTSAGIGGAAHLVNFRSTDNLMALATVMQYYGARLYMENPVPGNSIPASEHSTITEWGQEQEVDAYANIIKQYGDEPAYACVSDSYDLWRAIKEYWGTELKDKVLNAKGTLVVRPDSGPPAETDLECCNILGEKFGFTVNSKGYKVLNAKVRIIQGDGVNHWTIDKVLRTLEENRWSADNISFGSGGALLQKVDRDTQRFAFKCSSAVVNDQQIDVFKCPITDSTKVSKKGRMSLILKNGVYKTVPDSDRSNDCLRDVYLNGDLLIDESLEPIRKRAVI
jgi:nicotinamide phosphoribosyltransferase